MRKLVPSFCYCFIFIIMVKFWEGIIESCVLNEESVEMFYIWVPQYVQEMSLVLVFAKYAFYIQYLRGYTGFLMSGSPSKSFLSTWHPAAHKDFRGTCPIEPMNKVKNTPTPWLTRIHFTRILLKYQFWKK